MANPSRREFIPLPINVPNVSNWTVDAVRRALSEHEQGVFSNSAFLAEALERAPKTNAALNRRILTVLGLPFRLEAGDGDGRRNSAAVTKIKPHWRKIASRRTVGKMLRWGIGMGIAFGELVWRERKGEWIPRIKPWHASFFHWDETKRCYQAQTADGLVDVRPGDGNWVVFSYDEWDDQPWNRGVVRCLGIPDSIRNLAVRDWARYSEIHGIPMRLAEIPRDVGTKDEQSEFIDAIESPGNETTIIAPKGKDESSSYKVSLIEAQDQSWEGFDRLIARMDGDCALAITGIEMVNETGVYNPKDNSEGVRQDYTEADAVTVSEFLHEQVSGPWARFNLGEDAVDSAPRPVHDPSRPMDKQAAATTVKLLGEGLTALNTELRKASKQQVATEDFLSRFDVPLEAAPEDSLEPTPGEKFEAEQEQAKAQAQAAKQAPKPAPKKLATQHGQGLVDGQVYVDGVADAAIAARPGKELLARVMTELETSTGYDDLRARLVALFSGSEPISDRTLRQVLASASVMAQAAGLWSVEQE